MKIQQTFDATFINDSEKTTKFTAVITTLSIDRDNEVVIPSGMNSKEYEANPTLLFSHDPTKPIGLMTGMRRKENSIEADFELAPRPKSHVGEWFPDTVGSLMKFGALRGISVGYAPISGGMRNATKADVVKYGESVKRIYSKWKLLEVSVVSIPANQDSLVSAVSKGIISVEAIKKLGLKIPQSSNIKIKFKENNFDYANIARIEVAKLMGKFN